MVLANRDVTRKLAGNRSTAVLPDADIDQAIEASDSLVHVSTGKTDWDITDPGYDTAKKASEYFAAAELLSRWQDQEDESEEKFDRAQYYIKVLKENFATATGGTEGEGEDPGGIINIVTGQYHTSPMTYRSTRWLLYGDNGEARESLYPSRYP